ncbi:MAG: 4'-phosphopantetheinyl transferase superfamily protein [Actinomycetota bacterium]|nr:4'-phosphopantetheinyl transferase superfamily protein [Actinomycetota bacterium]
MGDRGASLMGSLLPSGVMVAELFGTPPERALLPKEAATVVEVSDRRRADFTAGRHCVRQALRDLGLGAVPVLTGPDGEPIWPAGVVGSISHCADYAVAAVARRSTARAIGVDAEPAEALPDGVLESITSVPERARVSALQESDGSVHWDRAIFSIKESCYKTWYPIERRWLGFDDVDVRIDGRARAFEARVLESARRTDFPEVVRGRWSSAEGLIVTALVLD